MNEVKRRRVDGEYGKGERGKGEGLERGVVAGARARTTRALCGQGERLRGQGVGGEGAREGAREPHQSFVVRQINNVVIVNALEQHAAGLHWRLFFAM